MTPVADGLGRFAFVSSAEKRAEPRGSGAGSD